MRVNVPISAGAWTGLFSRWDVLAFLLILGLLVFLGEASRHLFEPLTALQQQPISLDPRNLPEYAARTTLRMLIAMAASLVFTFTYATLAAKNKAAERLLVPLLDILQSVPILGFISVTVVFFMALAPGRVLGAEFASIFAIFTSQAWNMAFSFYQSLRTIPTELEEVDVRQLVLRRRFGGNQRRQYDGDASRHRLLYRARHRASGPRRGVLGDRRHADRDLHLRPGSVSAPRGLGRSLPLRAGARRFGARILGVRRVAPLAADRADHRAFRGAVAAYIPPAPG
jgi:hypothetical protein